jgi:methylmalonyl-CoA mutase
MAADQEHKESLFSEFPLATKAEWEALIEKDLKGADYHEKLAWDTLEGFSVQPFYMKEDLEKLEIDVTTARHQTTNWKCCEPVYDGDSESANKSIKQAIEGGANACFISSVATPSSSLALEGDITGTNLQSQNDFNRLAEEIETGFEFIFDCGMAAPAFRAMMKNTGRDHLTSSFVFDPFTYTARHGRLPVEEERLRDIIRLLAVSENDFTLCADASFYHNAGATIVQELGITLAIGSEFLASVDNSERNSAAASLFTKLSAGPLYFPEVAKFRALRRLWQNLLDAYNIKDPEPLKIIAETGHVNKTVAGSTNNILRSVTEGMSAVIGGADVLLIHPHDIFYAVPSEKSKRIARNVQHIIRKEAHFDKTNDPSAGSYYVENLTGIIARKAWKYFQQIEAEGGFLQALKNGSVQKKIQQARLEKEKAYKAGKKVLVGVNRYPNPEEEFPDLKKNVVPVNSLQKSAFKFTPKNGDELDLLGEGLRGEALLADVLPFYHNPQKVLYTTIDEFRAENLLNREES